MATSTSNLQAWIRKLQSLEREVAGAAFEDVRTNFEDIAHEILWQHAERAILDTVEYNIPIFKEPLRRAIMTKGCILLYQVGTDSIATRIDLDITAGNIEIYADAVSKVRESYKTKYSTKNIKVASKYWERIYSTAFGSVLEGSNEDSTSQAISSQIYHRTIEDRLALVGGLAPYWSIIDEGSYYIGELDRGGDAYPRFAQTNFVHSAEMSISSLMTKEYRRSLKSYTRALELERYGGSRLLNTITNVLEGADSSSISEGGILKVIEINYRNYVIYVTQTSKIGMRLQ